MTLSREMQELAQHLLDEEALAGDTTKLAEPAVVRVSEKLRGALSVLVGADNYRFLLSRALTLARVEAPGLSAVQITADGSLRGVGEVDLADYRAEAAVLIGQLLGLFLTFLGVPLTLRLLQDVSSNLAVTTKSGIPKPFETILQEVEQLNRVSDRLESLADQHPSVEDALITISANIRNAATTLDVLVLIKDPSNKPQENESKEQSKHYLM